MTIVVPAATDPYDLLFQCTNDTCGSPTQHEMMMMGSIIHVVP